MCKKQVKEYINYQTNEKLDLDRVSQLKDNAMLKVRPELWCEWNFEKNIESGLDIWRVTKGKNDKVWWICSKCESDYDMSINKRTSQNSNCPYCAGKRVNHTNSLASLNPELAKQWHPTKNGDLTPNNITASNGKRVWWLGKCGHHWKASVGNRHRQGNGCPYCSPHNQKVLQGFNDLWTTHPHVAELLANPEDGCKYSFGSDIRVDWKCPDCGEIVKNKVIGTVSKQGLFCSECSEGISFSEKMMQCLFNALNIEFIKELSSKDFKWIGSKRYDFYIPSLNMIIETHGIQHYQYAFKNLGGKTLQEEQANDKYKYELAIANGILPESYIVIDCRKSDFEFIKANILNSKLAELFDLSNVDWNEIGLKMNKSLVIEVCETYNHEGLSVTRLMSIFNLSRTTILRYLKIGNELGLIDFKPKKERPIVQLNKELNYIAEYNSISLACRKLNIPSASIKNALKNRTQSLGEFIWMDKDEYIKFSNGEMSITFNIKSNYLSNSRKVAQLDLHGNFIREWKSMVEASNKLRIDYSNISNVCRGKSKTAKGYKWMYLEDYKNMLEQNNLTGSKNTHT